MRQLRGVTASGIPEKAILISETGKGTSRGPLSHAGLPFHALQKGLLAAGASVETLEGLSNASEVTHLLVSFDQSFSEVWSRKKEILDWAAAGGHVVIVVWDRVPPGAVVQGIALHEFVTPFDWLMASALQKEGKGPSASGNKREPRFVIVDLNENVKRSYATRLICGQMPAHIAGLGAVQWIPTARVPMALAAILRGENTPLTELSQDLLRSIAVSNLTGEHRLRDRHSITNILGPRLLLGRVEYSNVSEAEGRVLAAFEVSMRDVGVIPDGDGQGVFTPFANGGLGDWFSAAAVIDDMYQFGWDEFIRKASALPDAFPLLCAVSAHEPCFGERRDTSLYDLMQENEQLRSGAGLSLSGVSGARELLFLDLRLFAGRPLSEEVAFLAKLLVLARQAIGDQLSWPGFQKDELEAIERCLERGGQENSDYFTALTMLPRLIAIVAPTLPIILFTSTGRREIIDRLRPYGTIITSFEKPRFFGTLSADFASQTLDGFRAALSAACKVGRARKLLEDLDVEFAKRSTLTVTPSKSGGTRDYVEVYIDESGMDPDDPFGRKSGGSMSVGGLVATYQDERSAGVFSTEMANAGLVWGYERDRNYTAAPKTFLRKADEENERVIENGFKTLEAVAKKAAVKLDVFTLVGGAVRDFELSGLAVAGSGFRALLRFALEALVFEMLVSRGHTVKARIFAGTRIWAAKSKRDVQVLDELSRSWGIGRGVLGSDEVAYTFPVDGVQPILAAAAASRRGLPSLVEVLGARGVVLRYFGRPLKSHSELPRQLHYAADWVVSRSDLVPNHWFEGGFGDRLDRRFASLMKAARLAADKQNRIQSLLAWAHATKGGSGPLSAARWVRERVRASASELDGAEFCRLAQALPE